MKVKTLFLVLLLIAGFYKVKAKTQIWYVPHPDDEIIGMGGSIRKSVLEGHKNIVVLLTKGKASNVRKLLALTSEAFGKARILESIEALKVLGINEKDIFIYDYPDKNLTIETARSVIVEFKNKYPNAIHNTVSVFDPHNDHQALAKALYREGKVSKLNINFYRVYIFRTHGTKYDTDAIQQIKVDDFSTKAKALEVFSRWEPEKGFYAIGQKSAPDLIAGASKTPYEYKDNLDVIPEIAYTRDDNVSVQDLNLFDLLQTVLYLFLLIR